MSVSFLYPAALFALLLLPLLALPFAGRGATTRTSSFWLGLGLRAAVLFGLVLALAGMQLVRTVGDLSVVFVLDHSDSVSQAEQQRAEAYVRAALGSLQAGDRAALVVFGENALVERLASEEPTLATVASIPRTARTDIAAALRLALALFPEESNKRLVLLSDGLENAGRAGDLVDLARARGVRIDVVSLQPPTGQVEAYLDVLEAPASVRQGQGFEAVAVVQSTLAGPATLRLFADGTLVATRSVTLQAGENRLGFALTADEPGFHRYSAELEAAADTLPQNNAATAFTVVQGPPRVLLVEGNAGDGDNLLAALASAGIVAERLAPPALPGDLTVLAGYDALYLVNVPAASLPDAAMNALPAYVRDLGRGLVMIGGPDSYGAGGYLRTPLEKALPVDMDVRSRTQEPNLALVFVLDKSGSMGRCHCDDPNALPGSYARVESGLSKVDIAKDAVLQAARAVGPQDYLGIVAFDQQALWALPPEVLAEADIIQERIGGLQAEGQTNVYAGLAEAEAALVKTDARLKHIVLVTDGWSRSFQYAALAQRLQAEGITLSVVAAGDGSATYLEQLAVEGGGRYYPARNMAEVPALFFKETVEAQGRYIVEEPFLPAPASTTPILRGLDLTRLPALWGYNGTTPKATARVALVSSQGDPILATWQYGLGHAVAWTSDARGQWATEWVRWDGFSTFVAQMANWVLPQPADAGLQTTFASDGGGTLLEVTSTDAAGRPRDLLETEATIVGPDQRSQRIALSQMAPGRYRGQVLAAEPGVYLAQVRQQEPDGTPVASATSGLVVPYSPEYKLLNPEAGVLAELARATGGQELADPAQAFARLPQPAARSQPIWPALLLAAALLFPFDVAVRRLRLSRADGERFLAWARVTLARRPLEAGRRAPRALGALFAARERARRPRVARAAQVSPPAAGQPEAGGFHGAPAAAPTSETMTERLRKAKERSRRGRP